MTTDSTRPLPFGADYATFAYSGGFPTLITYYTGGAPVAGPPATGGRKVATLAYTNNGTDITGVTQTLF